MTEMDEMMDTQVYDDDHAHSNSSSSDFSVVYLSESGMTTTGMANADDIHQCSLLNATSDLDPDELNAKLLVLLEENDILKEVIRKNNSAIKEQFEFLNQWQARIASAQMQYQRKSDEDKISICHLRAELEKCKERFRFGQSSLDENLREKCEEVDKLQRLNHQLEVEMVELRTDCQKLKNINAILQEKSNLLSANTKEHDSTNNGQRGTTQATTSRITDNFEFCVVDSTTKEESLQVQRSICESLREELEAVRLRLKMFEKSSSCSNQQQNVFDNSLESSRGHLKMSSSNIEKCTDRTPNAESFIRHLECEINTLNRNLEQETQKNSDLREKMVSLQNQLEELQYSKMASVEVLAAKDAEIAKFQRHLGEIKHLTESYPVLEAQLEVYKSDFEAEHKACENLNDEKEQLLAKLYQLQSDQNIHSSQRHKSKSNVHLSHSARIWSSSERFSSHKPDGTTEASRYKGSKSPSNSDTCHFECPKCHWKFRDLDRLHNHLDICLENSNSGAD